MDLLLPHIAGRLFGRPHAIEPGSLKSILDAAWPRILGAEGAESEGNPDPAKLRSDLAQARRDATLLRLSTIVDAEPIPVGDGIADYGLTAAGIAVIPILGTLVDRFDWIAAMCGFCTYDTVALTVGVAVADERVRGIILDVESPGGEAAGMLDCGDRIAAAAAAKPLWAVANKFAYSAAYGLACGASRLVLPRVASVGSIGVVMIHIDQSALDAERGLAFTAIYSGAHKIDGWGHAPLTDAARDDFQRGCDEVRQKFAEHVAKHRKMKVGDVMKTEAGCYDDVSAVASGLADEILTFDDALAALTEQVSSTSTHPPARRTAATTITTLQPGATGDAMTTAPDAAAAPAAPAVTQPAAGQPVPQPPAPPAASPALPAGQAAAPTEAELREQLAAQMAQQATAGPTPPPAPPGETAEQMAARVRSEAAEILDLCRIAGKPGAAADFVRRGMKPTQVRQALLEQAVAAYEATAVTAISPTALSSNAAAASWDSVIAKVNQTAGLTVPVRK